MNRWIRWSLVSVLFISFLMVNVVCAESTKDFGEWQITYQRQENAGNYDEAFATIEEAIKDFPETHVPTLAKAQLHYKLHQYDEAIAALDEALKIKPKDFLTLQNKGATYCELRKYDDAIRSFNDALAIDPDHYWVYNDIGIVLDKQEKYEEALEMFDTSLDKSPNAQTWSLKGNTLIHLGEYEKALDAYKEGVALLEENPYNAEYWGDTEIGLVSGMGTM